MKDIVYIFGCGGHARSIINIIMKEKADQKIVLIDPKCEEGEHILGCKTVREDDFWKTSSIKNIGFIAGIGDNQKRRYIYNRAVELGLIPQCVISKTAVLGIECSIGEGSYVADFAHIGPEVSIGIDTIINTGSIIEHETKIGNHTHVAPGTTICGRCRVGNNVFIGAGSVVIDGITIADGVTLGAGSVVISDIDKKGTYVGCPAKQIHA